MGGRRRLGPMKATTETTAGVHNRRLARFFFYEDLRQPCKGSTEAEAPPSSSAEASAGGSTLMSGGEASCSLH